MEPITGRVGEPFSAYYILYLEIRLVLPNVVSLSVKILADIRPNTASRAPPASADAFERPLKAQKPATRTTMGPAATACLRLNLDRCLARNHHRRSHEGTTRRRP